jgi:hypothetical protein
MFTKNQIEEIRDKLVQLGVKDTEFKVTEEASEDDMIAIVSGGENKTILLKDLLSEAAGTIIIE